jgi:hypothetical protein
MTSMKESKFHWRGRRTHGQSIVEFALMAPILLILLSGLFEFGFLFNSYLAVLDSARNASRFASDSQFDTWDDITDCSSTDFYRQTACLAVSELAASQPTIDLCLPGMVKKHCTGFDWDEMDDVIVSVFSILRTPSTEVKRFPEDLGGCVEYGWSYATDQSGLDQCGAHRYGMHVSKYPSAKIESLLATGAPNTGFVLVEINYHYWQMLSLPWFTQFVPDPINLNLYALWPLVSAEPTSTPKPP